MPEMGRLPAGTMGLAFEDAIRRLELRNRLAALFERWGYLPAATPIVDFYDVYREWVNPQHVYRFTDREGDLVVLRSDATLFLARLLGLQLSEISQPLRLWYAEETISHIPSNHPVGDTGFQAGAEYIGLPQGEADWEVIILASEALECLGLQDYRIHLGSRALARVLIEAEGQTWSKDLIRDIHRLSGPCWENLSANLRHQFQCIGEPDQIAQQLGPFASCPEAAFLLQSCDILRSAGLGERLVIDLNEVGLLSYYTGLVFKIYVPGYHEAVVSGGRYDGLLKKFGIEAPSVGFSLQQGLIEVLHGSPEPQAPPAAALGTSWLERLADARRRRAKGEKVVL